MGLVDGVQLILNLFESRPMNSILPLCAARGVGVIARCVLDSGGLTGTLAAEDFVARRFLKHAPVAEYQARAAALEAAFAPASLTELAIRFSLSVPGVSSMTLGMPEARMVDEAVAAIAKGALPAGAVEAIRREHVWSKNFYERIK